MAVSSSQITISTASSSGAASSGPGRTTVAAPKAFKDLPAETRNRILESCAANPGGIGCHFVSARNIVRRFPPTIDTSRVKRSQDLQFMVALELCRSYPFLSTSKAIMQDAFQMCLGACTLHIEDILDLEVLVKKPFDFAPVLRCFKHIRSASILIPKNGRIVFRGFNGWPSMRCLTTLKTICPKLETLEIQLSDRTFTQWSRIRTHFSWDSAIEGWPALRKVEIKHVDMEARLRRQLSSFLFGAVARPFSASGPSLSGPQLPWHLDMEVRFVEQFNEDLVDYLRVHRRTLVEEGEE